MSGETKIEFSTSIFEFENSCKLANWGVGGVNNARACCSKCYITTRVRKEYVNT